MPDRVEQLRKFRLIISIGLIIAGILLIISSLPERQTGSMVFGALAVIYGLFRAIMLTRH
ncbi:MAG: hypothetical protein Q7N50_00045 [Armatimonadota bacterium]|nr:hypothetical protein [Armatimonadota bacterium]